MEDDAAAWRAPARFAASRAETEFVTPSRPWLSVEPRLDVADSAALKAA